MSQRQKFERFVYALINRRIVIAMAAIEIISANLDQPAHQQAVLTMVDAYSKDPRGDNRPLSDFARANLVNGLRQHPTTQIFLAMQNDQPLGIAVCFRGFSTFAASADESS